MAKKKAASAGLIVERVPITSVRLDPENARLHLEASVGEIRKSLERFKQQKPIVIDRDGVVVAGNGTVQAAAELGWTHIDVVRTELTGVERRAFALADNRTAELSEWNVAVLAAALEAIAGDDHTKLQGMGFTVDDMAMFAIASAEQSARNVEPEPALPSQATTRSGDMWIVGEHRVWCGDSSDGVAVAAILNGERVNLAITSPPYAEQRDYDDQSGFQPVPPDEYVEWFAPFQKVIADNLANDGSWCLNIKEHCEDGERVLYVKDLTIAHVRQWGWAFVDEYCWVHGGTPKVARRRFKNGWEPVFHFTRGDHKWRPAAAMHRTQQQSDMPEWYGGHPSNEKSQGRPDAGKPRSKRFRSRTGKSIAQGNEQWSTKGGTGDYVSADGLAYPSNVLSVGKNREALGHSAAYPIGLPEFFIKCMTDRGDLVFDPFAGSGTTACAADACGLRSLSVEISPLYCDVIVQRLERLTGMASKLESTGKTFDDMRTERVGELVA